jgi:hypothetical protein
MQYTPAGEGKKNFVDANIIMRQHGFSCHSIKYFFYAVETFEWFAVYEGDGDRDRLREVEGG